MQSTPEAKPTKGHFLLDLGSNQSLDLRGNIEVPNGLPLRHASGLGGEVQIPVGRIHQLKLGTYELLEPITAFEATDRHNSNRLSGRIGNQILSRFKVIFNYAKKQVILEPIQETASLIEADMSGLRLALNDSPSREVVVNHVYPNSPAQSAGIRAGDRLLAIDGQSVDTFSLSDIRQQFLGPPQTIREVLLERAETALSVRLQLRRLI